MSKTSPASLRALAKQGYVNFRFSASLLHTIRNKCWKRHVKNQRWRYPLVVFLTFLPCFFWGISWEPPTTNLWPPTGDAMRRRVAPPATVTITTTPCTASLRGAEAQDHITGFGPGCNNPQAHDPLTLWKKVKFYNKKVKNEKMMAEFENSRAVWGIKKIPNYNMER